MNSGRSLGVHDRHQLGRLGRLQRLLDPLGLDDSCPIRRPPDGLSRRAASATSAIRAPNTPLTPTTTSSPVLDQVRHHGLHPGRAGARDRKVISLAVRKTNRSIFLMSSITPDEVGIEMADHRRQHRLHHARMNVRGAGSEQHAGRRLQFRKRGTGQRRSPFSAAGSLSAPWEARPFAGGDFYSALIIDRYGRQRKRVLRINKRAQSTRSDSARS